MGDCNARSGFGVVKRTSSQEQCDEGKRCKKIKRHSVRGWGAQTSSPTQGLYSIAVSINENFFLPRDYTARAGAFSTSNMLIFARNSTHCIMRFWT
jgi:hypothetical protein